MQFIEQLLSAIHMQDALPKSAEMSPLQEAFPDCWVKADPLLSLTLQLLSQVPFLPFLPLTI